MNGEGPCARCGKDPAAGYAQIGDDWYCHETMKRGATCYMRASWEQSGASFSEMLTEILGMKQSRIEVLEGILERVRGNWHPGMRGDRILRPGFWFRFKDINGVWLAPMPNGVQTEPMTGDEQVEIYGEIVYAGEKETKE